MTSYNLLLKSYQLKDLLAIKGIFLNVDDSGILLESGFLQSLSKEIRKRIMNSFDYNHNKLIKSTLLNITHHLLISSLNKFERKLKLTESFSCKDLIDSANMAGYGIEYLASGLLLSDKFTKNFFDNLILDEHLSCKEALGKNTYKVIDKIKEDVERFTCYSNLESLFFTDIFLKEEFRDELKVISVPTSRTLRDINKLCLWSQNLIRLIKEHAVIVSVPQKIKDFDKSMEKFFIKHLNEDNFYDGTIITSELFCCILKGLDDILLYISENWQEEFLGSGKDNLFQLLFKRFYLALNLTSSGLEQLNIAFNYKNILNLITGIQLLGISRKQFSLMLDSSNILFENQSLGLIVDNLMKYYFQENMEENIFDFLNGILNDVYLKKEIFRDSYFDNSFFGNIIEQYEKGIKEIEYYNSSNELKSFLNGLTILLLVNNRFIIYDLIK